MPPRDSLHVKKLKYVESESIEKRYFMKMKSKVSRDDHTNISPKHI